MEPRAWPSRKPKFTPSAKLGLWNLLEPLEPSAPGLDQDGSSDNCLLCVWVV